jgi:hypothetical protein
MWELEKVEQNTLNVGEPPSEIVTFPRLVMGMTLGWGLIGYSSSAAFARGSAQSIIRHVTEQYLHNCYEDLRIENRVENKRSASILPSRS